MVDYVSNQTFMKLNLKKSFKAFRFLIQTFNFIVCRGNYGGKYFVYRVNVEYIEESSDLKELR